MRESDFSCDSTKPVVPIDRDRYNLPESEELLVHLVPSPPPTHAKNSPFPFVPRIGIPQVARGLGTHLTVNISTRTADTFLATSEETAPSLLVRRLLSTARI